MSEKFHVQVNLNEKTGCFDMKFASKNKKLDVKGVTPQEFKMLTDYYNKLWSCYQQMLN